MTRKLVVFSVLLVALLFFCGASATPDWKCLSANGQYISCNAKEFLDACTSCDVIPTTPTCVDNGDVIDSMTCDIATKPINICTCTYAFKCFDSQTQTFTACDDARLTKQRCEKNNDAMMIQVTADEAVCTVSSASGVQIADDATKCDQQQLPTILCHNYENNKKQQQKQNIATLSTPAADGVPTWMCPKTGKSIESETFADFEPCVQQKCTTCQPIPTAQLTNKVCALNKPDINDATTLVPSTGCTTIPTTGLPCPCKEVCSPDNIAFGPCTAASWKRATQCGEFDTRYVGYQTLSGIILRPIDCAGVNNVKCGGTNYFPPTSQFPNADYEIDYPNSGAIKAQIKELCQVHAGCAAQRVEDSTQFGECQDNNLFVVCDFETCGQPTTRWKECMVNGKFFREVWNDIGNVEYNKYIDTLCTAELAQYHTVRPACACPNEVKCLPRAFTPQTQGITYFNFTSCDDNVKEPTDEKLLIGFKQCDTYCADELVPMNYEPRKLYCRETTGRFVEVTTANWEKSECRHLPQPKEFNECPGTVPCKGQWFCHATDKLTTGTTTWPIITSTQTKITLTQDKICTEYNQLSDTCYIKQQDGEQFKPETCIIDGIHKQEDLYRQRIATCLTYVEQKQQQNDYHFIPSNVKLPQRFGNDNDAFCHYAASSTTQYGVGVTKPQTIVVGEKVKKCATHEGCVPTIDQFTFAAPKVTEGGRITFKWVFFGPKANTQRIRLEWAYASTNTDQDVSLEWTPFVTDIKATAQSATVNAPQLDERFTNYLYIRIALIPTTGMTNPSTLNYLYGPTTLEVERIFDCTKIDCSGPNVASPACKIIEGVPTCQCITPRLPGTVFNKPEDNETWGVCERTNNCDRLSESGVYCKNGGYMPYDAKIDPNTPNADTRIVAQCSQNCVCPPGRHGSFCESECSTNCTAKQGVPQFDQCACFRCYDGFSGDFCENCRADAIFTFTNVSSNIQQAFNAFPNTIGESRKNQFIDKFVGWVADYVVKAHGFERQNVQYNYKYSGLNYTIPGVVDYNAFVSFAAPCSDAQIAPYRKELDIILKPLQLFINNNGQKDKKTDDEIFNILQAASTTDLDRASFDTLIASFKKSAAWATIATENTILTIEVLDKAPDATGGPVDCILQPDHVDCIKPYAPAEELPPPPPVPKKAKKSNSTTIIVAVVCSIGGVLIIAGLVVFFLLYLKPQLDARAMHPKTEKKAENKKEKEEKAPEKIKKDPPPPSKKKITENDNAHLELQ